MLLLGGLGRLGRLGRSYKSPIRVCACAGIRIWSQCYSRVPIVPIVPRNHCALRHIGFAGPSGSTGFGGTLSPNVWVDACR